MSAEDIKNISLEDQDKAKADKKEELLERSGPVFNPPVYIQRYTTVRDILFKMPGIEKVLNLNVKEVSYKVSFLSCSYIYLKLRLYHCS